MLRSSLVLAGSLFAAGAVHAQGAAPAGQAAGASVAGESVGQRFARDRLLEMARTLGAAERFSVSLHAAYDVVQDNGQKIEFGEIREIELQRPDKIRVAESTGDGSQDLILFDGKSITVQDGATSVFAQAPQPGDIDDSVKYFVRDLQMRMPLAPLLLKDFAGELQRRVRSIDYVGLTDILGTPAHHIAARTAQADFQVWIAQGAQPTPLRIVMSYPASEGHPQFRADFSKWDLSPTFAADRFEFTPSAEAQQIIFAVQLVPPPDAGEAAEGAVTEGVRP